ncbi:hypothetical protein J9303_15990 [Bacillaceae bacterium Marseille-Q3522]|nr:hypothetical protein [Bacillaceae bacterium Marseille-Q3522]
MQRKKYVQYVINPLSQKEKIKNTVRPLNLQPKAEGIELEKQESRTKKQIYLG